MRTPWNLSTYFGFALILLHLPLGSALAERPVDGSATRELLREDLEAERIDIDGVLATAPLLAKCSAAGIDYNIRGMEKPSDHCPVWAEFGI